MCREPRTRAIQDLAFVLSVLLTFMVGTGSPHAQEAAPAVLPDRQGLLTYETTNPARPLLRRHCCSP